MSVTKIGNDIQVTRLDSLNWVITSNGVPYVFEEGSEIEFTIYDNSNMTDSVFQRNYNPDENGNIYIILNPEDNNFEYGTYWYTVVYLRSSENFRKCLLPASRNTDYMPKYIVCRGDGSDE